MEFNCVKVLSVENLFDLENEVLNFYGFNKYDILWLSKHLFSLEKRSSLRIEITLIVGVVVIVYKISLLWTSSSLRVSSKSVLISIEVIVSVVVIVLRLVC